MNDKNIMQAFERCVTTREMSACTDCPASKYCFCEEKPLKVDNRVARLAVDVMKRQQAEIERLQAEKKRLYREIERIALMTSESEEKRKEGAEQ